MFKYLATIAIAAAVVTPLATGANATPRDNSAKAWTASCHAEFGKDAKYPDAKLLSKCLNFGNSQNSQQKNSKGPAAASNKMKQSGKPTGNSATPDNTAKAWTASCHAEFGSKAKYPDAKLLKKCLNY